MRYALALCFIALLLSGCLTANRATRTVRIVNPNLLIISDLATDNYSPVTGVSLDTSFSVPIDGMASPVSSLIQGGGIMSAGNIEIVSATGGTVIIERGVSGNAGVAIPEALSKLFKPTNHPFGNITVDEGSAMREHLEEITE